MTTMQFVRSVHLNFWATYVIIAKLMQALDTTPLSTGSNVAGTNKQSRWERHNI
jgi:hypothetical protein